MTIYNWLKTWIGSFLRLFVPPLCAVCGRVLQKGEEGICMRCNITLPRTDYHRRNNNPVEVMFFGKFPIERGSSYFYYMKGNSYRQIVLHLKYRGRRDLGQTMGRFMARELSGSGFFDGIDFILPIPLHPRKQRMRGYNQSEQIAIGISSITGIPVENNAVARIQFTQSQTRKKTILARWENVDGLFSLVGDPRHFSGKHILLVDDVLTTGATITACADAFKGVKDIRFSVLTLAKAHS